MDNKWYYKNFNMVVELDIAGEFIYNGINELNRMEIITNDAPTFFSLYNISVGLERLQKIVLVLWKLEDTSDEEKFEKSLITHIYSLLKKNINKYTKNSKYSCLNERENDFITLIQKFYNTARYERFNIYGKNDDEISIFSQYINKYVKDVQKCIVQNGIILTYEVKEFIGRVVGSISHKYYKLIEEGSNKNNTFTYELRSGSKAQKIFLPEYKKKSLMEGKLKERIAFKEIFVYIRNSKDKSAFFKFLNEIKPLEFDPALIIDYLKELSEGNISQKLIDDVEWLYDENGYDFERAKYVDLIGDTGVRFDYPDIEACNNILFRVIEEKKVNDDIIDCLDEHMHYIEDDEIIEVLNGVKESFQEYKDGKCDFNNLLKQVKEYYGEYQNFLINEVDETGSKCNM